MKIVAVLALAATAQAQFYNGANVYGNNLAYGNLYGASLYGTNLNGLATTNTWGNAATTNTWGVANTWTPQYSPPAYGYNNQVNWGYNMPAVDTTVHKAAYHVGNVDMTRIAIGNMKNHVQGMKDLGKRYKITAVINAFALQSFVKDNRYEKNPDGVEENIKALREDGVEFLACSNTMKAFGLTMDDLFEIDGETKEGGVTRLALLQDEGYAYIKP